MKHFTATQLLLVLLDMILQDGLTFISLTFHVMFMMFFFLKIHFVLLVKHFCGLTSTIVCDHLSSVMVCTGLGLVHP